MFDTILENATAASMAAVVYHHAVYPKLAARLGRRSEDATQRPLLRRLPALSIMMPAYNEAGCIAAKIHNIAGQDYPAGQLQILIGCDGCSDATADLARRAAACHPGHDIQVIEFPENRGKIAMLNDLMARATGAVTVLTDVSALLPVNGLSRLAAHFGDERVGAVGAGYRPALETNPGEKAYWDYQRRIKAGESVLGGLIGAHGACYAIQTGAWRPLKADTVNDDFIVPMEIALQGWRTVYDPSIACIELDAATDQADFRRRIRIGEGNAQQLWRLLPKLRLDRPGLAFAFLSGKGLRVAMPFLMAFSLAGAAMAAAGSDLMLMAASMQGAAYGVAAAAWMVPELRRIGTVEALRYLVAGHIASAIGAMRFAFARRRGAWGRVGGGNRNPGAAA
ncbi:MAG: glycosyltransferase family 2 protein [Minwuia sp.]|uniref:glycosyltransferase family 2 protein n=1 Tax=Minwuia sp. TaxID=2493630 RepID=UPI003A8611CE